MRQSLIQGSALKKSLVTAEIKSHLKCVNSLESEFLTLKLRLSQKIGRFSFMYINRFSEEQKKEYKIKYTKIKLWNLGLDISAMYLENTSTIRNLSARFVTDSEKKLFSKGLDFVIFPQYLNILDVQAEFEKLYHDVRSSLSQPQRTEFKRMLINIYWQYFILLRHKLSKFKSLTFLCQWNDKTICHLKHNKKSV